MKIPVASAVGYGRTELSAFDQALVHAGVADRNLIYLSSVLPPGAVVEQVTHVADVGGRWGDRLYCVRADARTPTIGEQVWAGIGWAQDASGRGLLVEHHAGTEQQIRDLITTSLEDLCKSRGGVDLPRRGMRVAGATCVDQPVCALVVAVFETAGWAGAGPANRLSP